MTVKDYADLARKLWPFLAGYVQQTGGSTSVITAGASSSTSGDAAPAYASFLTLAADPTLTQERTFAVSGLGLSTTDGGAGSTYTLTLTSSSNPGANARILASDANGFLTLPQFLASTKVRTPLIDTASGALTLTPATGVTLTDGKTLNGSTTFVSGFAGAGWRIDQGVSYASQATAEFDNLVVRGLLRVYELVINKIRVSRGSMIVSPGGGKVATVSGSGPYTLTFDDDHGILANDLLRAQKFTGSGTYQSLMTVTGVSGLSVTATLNSGVAPAAGYEYAVVGNTSNATRQGGLFLTADDSGAPFMDIYDEVSAHAHFNTSSKTKVRLGRLTGITDPFYGTLSGYGLYTNRAYLTNAYISGSVVIGPGIGFSVAPSFYAAYDVPVKSVSVNTNGYHGERATFTGGINGSPTPLGGGVAVGLTTTNKVNNPSLEGASLSGYGTDSTGGTIARSTDFAYFGDYSLKLVTGTGNNSLYYFVAGTLAAGHHTFSVYARRANGTAISGVTMFIDSTLGGFTPEIYPVGNGWYRIVGTRFLSNPPGNQVVGLAGLAANTTYYFDGFQVTNSTDASPYFDGSLGAGFGWAGTAHASFSTRTASLLTYPIGDTNPNAGTVMGWFEVCGYNINGGLLWNLGNVNAELDTYIGPTGTLYFRVNLQNLTHQTTVTRGWHHIACVWNSLAGTSHVYLDGVPSTSTGSITTTPPTLGTSIGVGCSNVLGAGYNGNVVVSDFAIVNRAMTSDEIAAVYASGNRLNVTRSNYELMLTDTASVARVTANSGGIFGLDAFGKPTFSLVNAGTTVNGEVMTVGDTMLGDNSSGKGNVLFDQSAGSFNIRTGTSNVLSFASAGSAIEGVLSFGANGGIWQGAGSFASPTTGLRIRKSTVNDNGVIEMYNAGTRTFFMRGDTGFTMTGGTGYAATGAFNFVNSSGSRLGELYGYTDNSTKNIVSIRAYANSSSIIPRAYMVSSNDHASGSMMAYMVASKVDDVTPAFSKPWAFTKAEANNSTNFAVAQLYAESTSEATQFYVSVTGSTSSTYMSADTHIFTGTKSGFHIDHPLHPLTKTLSHTPVDGDQLYTFYAGEVTLDNNGAAMVEMPDWFTALNGRVMYQLTCMDEHAPVYVTEQRSGGKITGAHRFTIQGGKAGQRVCWQVTGVRQDAWARYQPFVVEADKPEAQRGTLIKGKARNRAAMTYKPPQQEVNRQ